MRLVLTMCAVVVSSVASFAQLTVVAIDPPLNASNRQPNTSILIDFDRAVSAASLGNVRIYGNVHGPISGSTTLENSGTRIRFDPARAFAAGELVTVSLSNQLQAQDASFLRAQGYVASFRVKAGSAPATFTQIAQWDTDPNVFARVYGAQSCDLDGDDFPDLALICENTSDVRVFLNHADATGSYGPMLNPTNGVGSTPSPNENGDMNHDAFTDIVTCDAGGSAVSVLLGNGDGTFQPALTYSMGNDPHGMSLLDVDGDGDLDVVLADAGSSDLALRKNNGDGTLGPVSFIEAGVDGEWGLQPADMNNDGIVDLVAGGQWSNEISVLISNGNGTFQAPIVRFAGGAVWQIACGDLNGDGKMDVTTANGGTGNGSIFLGNGNGTLQLPTTYPAGGGAVATDLGDLDGDGDLDWVMSSFGGGQWRVHLNNGAGVFTLLTTIPAISNCACCVILDIDNDRDLDLVLLDEIDDSTRVMENGALDQQSFCTGTAAACPCGNAGATGHGCEISFGTGGGLLTAQGKASVSTDRLVLNASGLPPSASMIFFQGTSTLGAGAPFGDGLRCIAVPTRRLGFKTTVNGFTSIGFGIPGDPLLSVQGAVPSLGGTIYYQAWFRNPVSFCTAATFNLTNGLRVTWTP
jgi:hypothetical protein